MRKTTFLFAVVTNMLFGAKAIWANTESSALTEAQTSVNLVQGVKPLDALLEKKTNDLPESKQEALSEEYAKELPLAKVAHKDAVDLLHALLVPKPQHLPIYVPYLQCLAIKVNWFGLARRLWTDEHETYEGGIDLHFRGNIHLSIDLGHECYKPKQLLYGNQLKYQSKGKYISGSVRYDVFPHHLAVAYLGIGYVNSYFHLTPLYNNGATYATKLFTAGWLKLILGSEMRLIPHSGLYGGIQLGMMRLCHDVKNTTLPVSNYAIPGYGNVMNKNNFELIMYLKWSISFLEKKIVI